MVSSSLSWNKENKSRMFYDDYHITAIMSDK